MQSILIVGAGAIGLQTARLLAMAGCKVTLIDRSAVGTEASWAGGGIVSPLYPWRYTPAVTALAHWSQDFYPQLGEFLKAETGIDPEVHATGLYWLDLEDEAEALAWATREGRPLRRLRVEEVYERVPPLAHRYRTALFMPGVANVRNPRLLRALRVSVQSIGVQVLENWPVAGFVQQDGRILGVRAEDGSELRADSVVLTAGAWSGQLLATLGLALQVEPVRGQMIVYKCAADYLPAIVMAAGRYAIPRRDGHVLVGSTLEYTGFDKSTTEEALESLRVTAAELLPALAGAEVVRHWAGLRPGSPDGIPFIGPVPGHQGLWLNCGHFRNGLVLAPASCQLLTDLLLQRSPVLDPAPYDPALRLHSIG